MKYEIWKTIIEIIVLVKFEVNLEWYLGVFIFYTRHGSI